MRANLRSKLTANKIILLLTKYKTALRGFGVKKIGLFGSFIKNKQYGKSDIDFIVTFDRPSFDKYMELKFFLEKLFSKKVDLVMEKSLKPSLDYIKGEAVYVKGI